MLRVDPTPPGTAASTPLFRDPLTNRPISYQTVLDTTRTLMASVGEDPNQFGTHSYRIGGATIDSGRRSGRRRCENIDWSAESSELVDGEMVQYR